MVTLNQRFAIGALLLLPLLNGCATMSEAECNNANWQIRGEDDGMAGYRRDRVNLHTKACAEYGIKPDLVQYDAGWSKGIRTFCTADNGWSHGLSGKTYESSCPPDLEAGFYESFQLGSEIYNKQNRISTLETELAGVDTELDDLVDDDSKRSKLKDKRGRLREELVEAHGELAVLKVKAQQMGYAVP